MIDSLAKVVVIFGCLLWVITAYIAAVVAGQMVIVWYCEWQKKRHG